jgi:hypothetical protein
VAFEELLEPFLVLINPFVFIFRNLSSHLCQLLGERKISVVNVGYENTENLWAKTNDLNRFVGIPSLLPVAETDIVEVSRVLADLILDDVESSEADFGLIAFWLDNDFDKFTHGVP